MDQTTLIILVGGIIFLSSMVLAVYFLFFTGKKEGDTCSKSEATDKNGTSYEYDEDLECVPTVCKDGYELSGNVCVEEISTTSTTSSNSNSNSTSTVTCLEDEILLSDGNCTPFWSNLAYNEVGDLSVAKDFNRLPGYRLKMGSTSNNFICSTNASDYMGGTLKYSNVSLGECKEKCDTTLNCGGFQYNYAPTRASDYNCKLTFTNAVYEPSSSTTTNQCYIYEPLYNTEGATFNTLLKSEDGTCLSSRLKGFLLDNCDNLGAISQNPLVKISNVGIDTNVYNVELTQSITPKMLALSNVYNSLYAYSAVGTDGNITNIAPAMTEDENGDEFTQPLNLNGDGLWERNVRYALQLREGISRTVEFTSDIVSDTDGDDPSLNENEVVYANVIPNASGELVQMGDPNKPESNVIIATTDEVNRAQELLANYDPSIAFNVKNKMDTFYLAYDGTTTGFNFDTLPTLGADPSQNFIDSILNSSSYTTIDPAPSGLQQIRDSSNVFTHWKFNEVNNSTYYTLESNNTPDMCITTDLGVASCSSGTNLLKVKPQRPYRTVGKPCNVGLTVSEPPQSDFNARYEFGSDYKCTKIT